MAGYRDGGVALDDGGHVLALRLDTEGERRDVEEEQLAAARRVDGALRPGQDGTLRTRESVRSESVTPFAILTSFK